MVDARIKPPKTLDEKRERSRQIETENIRLQISHLKTYPIVKSALEAGKIQITGLYYDLQTGVLSRVD